MPPTGPALRRLLKEMHELQQNPPEGIRVVPSEVDVCEVDAWVRGPDGTPYANGYFRIHFHFPDTYPATPPVAHFVTKIFHPNVGPNGAICVNTLKKDWTASLGLTHVLVTIKCLLIHPNPESALDEEAGRLILEGWEEFVSRARLMTGVHARVRPGCFDWVAPSEKEDSENAPTTGVPTKVVAAATTGNERVPAPLGTADANIVGSVPLSSGKRSAGGASGGPDKRKKALKRL